MVSGRKLDLISTLVVRIKIPGDFQNKPEKQNIIRKNRKILRKNLIGFYCN